MGRHSLSTAPAGDGTRVRRVLHRRTAVISTAVVLALVAGTAVAVGGGLLGDEPCGERMRLKIVASPDIAPAVHAVANRARERGVRTDGRCLDVQVSAEPSSDVAAELSSGGRPGHHVWLPDSDLWVEQVNAADGAVPLDDGGHVATTPITLAVVPSAAKRLKRAGGVYSWTELMTVTEREALRVGAADPDLSATGRLALARIAGSGDDPAAGTRMASTAALLSSRTSGSDAAALATLQLDDSKAEKTNSSRNEGLVLSEQAAFARNRQDDRSADLRLFYPDDGPASLDYPYTLIDGKKLTANEARAATRFLTLLGTEESQRTLAGYGFRSSTGKPQKALVEAAGAHDRQPYGEPPADPPSGEQVKAALDTWRLTRQGSRMTTVVDASGSMGEPVPGTGGRSRMDVAKRSLLEALDTFTPEDEIGLWHFATLLDGDRDYRELVPTERLGSRTEGDQSQEDLLTDAFGGLEPIEGGGTGLYDTALAAYRKATENYAEGKLNTVVLLTDGANEDPGGISRGDLVRELERLADPERPIPLIAIAVGRDADEEECEEIAAATGGSGHQVTDPADIRTALLKAVAAAGKED